MFAKCSKNRDFVRLFTRQNLQYPKQNFSYISTFYTRHVSVHIPTSPLDPSFDSTSSLKAGPLFALASNSWICTSTILSLPLSRAISSFNWDSCVFKLFISLKTTQEMNNVKHFAWGFSHFCLVAISTFKKHRWRHFRVEKVREFCEHLAESWKKCDNDVACTQVFAKCSKNRDFARLFIRQNLQYSKRNSSCETFCLGVLQSSRIFAWLWLRLISSMTSFCCWKSAIMFCEHHAKSWKKCDNDVSVHTLFAKCSKNMHFAELFTRKNLQCPKRIFSCIDFCLFVRNFGWLGVSPRNWLNRKYKNMN